MKIILCVHGMFFDLLEKFHAEGMQFLGSFHYPYRAKGTAHHRLLEILAGEITPEASLQDRSSRSITDKEIKNEKGQKRSRLR